MTKKCAILAMLSWTIWTLS